MSLNRPQGRALPRITTNMSNVTVRGKKNISYSTTKLIKKPNLQKAISVISLSSNTTKSLPDNKRRFVGRKAISLQDLTPANQKITNLKRQLFFQMENEQGTLPKELPNLSVDQQRTRRLAIKVYIAFLRNALRKISGRRDAQNQTVTALNEKLHNSKMQIETLKTLLKSDEQFIKDWIREFRKLKRTMSTILKERDELRIENHHLENNLELTKEQLNEAKVSFLNEKNSLQQVNCDRMALENQLDKEREKIRVLRNDLKNVTEKVFELEKTLSKKSIKSNKNFIGRNIGINKRKE